MSYGLIKPPHGAQIDMRHRLADKLRFYSLMNDFSGKRPLDATPRKLTGYAFSGAPAPTSRNLAGRGTYFDGSDDIISFDQRFAAHVEDDSPLTMYAVFRPTNIPAGDYTQFILADWYIYSTGSVNQGIAINIYSDWSTSRRLRFSCYANASDGAQIYTNSSLTQDTLYHCVCTKGGSGASNLKIYLNGVLQAVSTMQDYAWAGVRNTGLPLVGSRWNSQTSAPNAPFQGDIYAVGFWDRVLSAEEIKTLYADPWQMFKQRKRSRLTFFPPGGVGLMNGGLVSRGLKQGALIC